MARIEIVDKKLLNDLGVKLNDRDFELLSHYMETELSRRVIDEITEELSAEQARQLAEMRGANDDQILEWLRASLPDFSDIVSDEVDILLGELAENPGTFIRRVLMANG